VCFNGRVGARLISTRDASKVIELAGAVVTIGRAAECEYQIADDRVSGRHCRLVGHHGRWGIVDLRSTNRTFVNGELVGETQRWLAHGDIVRLGAADAVLFEARYVEARIVIEEHAPPRRPAVDEAALQQRIAELQATLLERNAEIVRVNAACRELQSLRATQLSATAAAERVTNLSSGEVSGLRAELAELREELATARREHAIDREAEQRARRRVTELEAQLATQERKARSDAQDSARHAKDLESKLRMALSDLALAREALAAAPFRESATVVLMEALDRAGNVGEALRLARPPGVDVSSGVESAPGVKDPTLIAEFFRAIRTAQASRAA